MSILSLGLSLILLLSVSSLATGQVAVQSSFRAAFEACLKQAFVAQPIQLRKSRASGTSDISLDIWCDGDPARQFFNRMAPYSNQTPSGRDPDDGTTYILRSMGDGGTQCTRIIAEASGATADRVFCNIELHVGEKALAAL